MSHQGQHSHSSGDRSTLTHVPPAVALDLPVQEDQQLLTHGLLHQLAISTGQAELISTDFQDLVHKMSLACPQIVG